MFVWWAIVLDNERMFNDMQVCFLHLCNMISQRSFANYVGGIIMWTKPYFNLALIIWELLNWIL